MLIRKKRRLENSTFTCPVVYGSISHWMGRKADEHATHRWTLFVRGPNDEDLSCFVSKIIFSLHPSFAVPIREILRPPFEVTEMGWGEFEAGIRIFFKDPDEKPVDILHPIKLYPGSGLQQSMKKPVMHEFYDEIVFTNPSEDFASCLLQYNSPSSGDRPLSHLAEFYTIFDEESDLQHLSNIQSHLNRELEAAKAQALQLDGEIAYMEMQVKSFSGSSSSGSIPALSSGPGQVTAGLSGSSSSSSAPLSAAPRGGTGKKQSQNTAPIKSE